MEDTFTLERAKDFADCPHDDADTVEKGYGRIEIRRCWAVGDPAYLAHVDPDRAGCDLASLIRVESERRGDDRIETNTRGFISSLLLKAKPLLQAIRRHGNIENALHWVLDVAFGEDDSRIRTGHAAHNRAIPGASPTTCSDKINPQGGNRQQAAGGGLEQGLPVPSDWPRTQTRLDAIALPTWRRAIAL